MHFSRPGAARALEQPSDLDCLSKSVYHVEEYGPSEPLPDMLTATLVFIGLILIVACGRVCYTHGYRDGQEQAFAVAFQFYFGGKSPSKTNTIRREL